jgi:hypothetical protein
MEKYGVKSTLTFQKILRNLVSDGDIARSEIKDRLPEECKAWDRGMGESGVEKRSEVVIVIRKTTRNTPFGELYVDDSQEFCNYRVLDISEAGLKVSPIQTKVGDIKYFRINPKEFDDVQQVVFSAKCRWTDGMAAGFSITRITPGNLAELKKLIQMFTFEEF